MGEIKIGNFVIRRVESEDVIVKKEDKFPEEDGNVPLNDKKRRRPLSHPKRKAIRDAVFAISPGETVSVPTHLFDNEYGTSFSTFISINGNRKGMEFKTKTLNNRYYVTRIS